MSNQLIFIGLSILVLLYLLLKGKSTWEQTLIAFIISLFWVKFSGIYSYSDAMYVVYGVNVFPLLCWTAGLSLFKALYDQTRFLWFVYFGIWVFGVLLLEWVGYHVMGIQLSSGYPGVFGTDILHVPVWAHIYYLTIGPLFLLVLQRN